MALLNMLDIGRMPLYQPGYIHETINAWIDQMEAHISALPEEQRKEMYPEAGPGTIVRYAVLQRVRESFFSHTQADNVFFGCHRNDRPTLYRHAHDYYELLFVDEGSLCIRAGAATFMLERGEVCLITPGFYHQVLSMAPNTTVLVGAVSENVFEQENPTHAVLDGEGRFSEYLQKALTCAPDRLAYIRFPTARALDLHWAFRDLLYAWFNGAQNMVVQARLYLFFVLLVDSDSAQNMKDNEKMAEILLYINEHYAEATLDSVARAFHYTPSYLSRLVRDAYGYTFTDALRNARMETALKLLRQGMTVDSVAQQTGYQRSRFHQVFKEHFGITPHAACQPNAFSIREGEQAGGT